MMEKELRPTWEWLWIIMESTEGQLRFGTSLVAASDPSQSGHPVNENQSKVLTSKDKRGNDSGVSVDKKGR